MTIENVLEKTNRINLLYDFYHHLLTERQQTFLKLYYHDNYSLGEIAEQFSISRQAINEHIKRAEVILQEYEDKLQLLSQHERRGEYFAQIGRLLDKLDDQIGKEAQEVSHHTVEIRRIMTKIMNLE